MAKALARAHTRRAIAVLAEIMDSPEAAESARVAAAVALLDRGWGKPTQPIAGDDEHDLVRISRIECVIKPLPDRKDEPGDEPGQ